jgi:hypothetical protein
MKKIITVLLLLIGLRASAQDKYYRFDAYVGTDTVHVETYDKCLVVEWPDKTAIVLVYDKGVFDYKKYDLICFDEFDVARYCVIEKDKKNNPLTLWIQFENGSEVGFKCIKNGKSLISYYTEYTEE